MNKKEKKELKRNIANEEYIEQNTELVFKKLIYNPLIRCFGLLILLVFSLITNDRIQRLAALTSNAIFSNEKVLGHVTYYTVLGITIGLCFLVFLGSLFVKSNLETPTIGILRKAYHFYSIYDMVIFILSTFVCLFFIIMILLTPCNISGSSMENTYHDGDRVILWSIGYEPDNGDVIVFDSAKYVVQNGESRFYIKRVIAKENDVLRFEPKTLTTGRLYVNNEFVEEITVSEYSTMLLSIDSVYSLIVTIPKDRVMVFGDNRLVSRDSRSIGLIDESEIIGKVLFRFYPFNKFGNPSPEIQ